MRTKVTIIGAGPAGVIAAETLVRLDPGSDVVVVGDEPGPPYSRMAIPYYLTGMIDEAGTRIRKTANHYQDLGIRLVQGRAEAVAAADGRLTLEGGESLAFDRLLVATGASAVKPPVPGLDADGVHHCWTLADARAIAALAGPGADVALMGAGFIGCIILQSLAERGVNLTVVEAEDRVLPRMMDATGGAMIKRWCEEKGVRVLTGARVTGVEPAANGSADKWVVMDGGDRLQAQLVVVATGVRSNMDFLAGSGVKTDTGVLVDEHLRTNVDTIFAAGDAAQGPDVSTGGWSVHAIQTTAADHGRIAARPVHGVGHHHVVVLFPDPAAAAQVGRRQQLFQCGERVFGSVGLGGGEDRTRGRRFPGPVVFLRRGDQGVDRNVRLDRAVLAQHQPAVAGDAADHGEIELPFLEDRAGRVLVARLEDHQHPFLAFGEHHFVRCHALLAHGHAVDVEHDAAVTFCTHLAGGTRQPRGPCPECRPRLRCRWPPGWLRAAASR